VQLVERAVEESRCRKRCCKKRREIRNGCSEPVSAAGKVAQSEQEWKREQLRVVERG